VPHLQWVITIGSCENASIRKIDGNQPSDARLVMAAARP
jgi:hypothetical protein